MPVPPSQSLKVFVRYSVLVLFVLYVVVGGGSGYSWLDVPHEASRPCRD